MKISLPRLGGAFGFSVTYLLVGAAIFKPLESEWSYIDAIYYCVVVLTTVGFGDLSPTHPWSKILTVLYAVIGIGIVFAVASNGAVAIIARQEELLEAAVVGSRDEVTARTRAARRRAERRRLLARAGGTGALFIANTIIGALLFAYSEGLSAGDAVYAAIVTMLTIGFGDYALRSPVARGIGAAWIVFATISTAWSLASLLSIWTERAQRRLARSIISRKLSADEIATADLDGDGMLSQSEFIVSKLRALNVLSDKQFEQLCTSYKKAARTSKDEFGIQNNESTPLLDPNTDE